MPALLPSIFPASLFPLQNLTMSLVTNFLSDAVNFSQNAAGLSQSCQTNTPGGLLLLTSFWDYSPATGPSDSWTICDGSYESSCDSSRNSNQIAKVLQDNGADDVLDYMNTYWVDINGNQGSFWSHEWDKHGTCVSTIAPSCYSNYHSGQDIVDFFTTATDLFKQYDLYGALSAAGIQPSTSKTYTLAQLQNAAKKAFGQTPAFRCKSGGNVDEAWFFHQTTGRATSASNFVLVAPLDGQTTCPSSGIKYNPKSG
ncbi:putative ribonuclease T2 [Acaromyces ingoldii]|uniref:ribonuclease T2 n=1 Tax=Acaromyces ingoldii TaxID=215250 RepID=A0A316YVD2_9BASI|nr:putative ribonuclease T2 [Acaromyces ingoldii]PWN92744.1 putative ribonuclease T2 [Acaromyces ingoldii]